MKSSETSRDLNGYLEPLKHLCTVLNIANERCIRRQEITLAYGSSFSVESLFARVLKKFWQSSPIPPFVPNTSGVKVPISTSQKSFLKNVPFTLGSSKPLYTCITVYMYTAFCFYLDAPQRRRLSSLSRADRTTHKLKKSSEDKCVCRIDSFCIRR